MAAFDARVLRIWDMILNSPGPGLRSEEELGVGIPLQPVDYPANRRHEDSYLDYSKEEMKVT